MPTKVQEFSLWRAIEGMERALKKISRANGYNTTPGKVQVGAVLLEKVPPAEFPKLCFEMGDLDPLVEGDLYGGGVASTGHLRFAWPAVVWGYVQTSEDKKALYRAGTALLADVFAAVYEEETLPDNSGTGSVYFVNTGEIVFDMESFAQDKKGYFAAELRLVVNVERGATP